MSAASPHISVLLPFRDARATLGTALRCLRRQTWPRFEVVAVDDGSQDGGHELVDAMSRGDGRFRLLRQPPLGLVAALNLGLGHCRGELLARMDADDACVARRLEVQRRFLLENPAITVAGSLVRIFPRRWLTEGMGRYEAWLNRLLDPHEIRRELWVESPLCHPSVMLRTESLRRLGGFSDAGWPEDYDLWLRMDRAGHQLAKVPDLLYFWRDSPARLTRSSPRYSRESFFALKLHHLLSRCGPDRRLLVWGAGREGKPWLKALRGAGRLGPVVVDVDPRKLGQRIHGCRVVPPEDLPPPSEEVLVVAAVGAEGARQQIRAFLDARGYQETRHYVCVA